MTAVTPFVKTIQNNRTIVVTFHLHGENNGLQYEGTNSGHTITAKKKTKSMNSLQKAQEYIKGKSPLSIL